MEYLDCGYVYSQSQQKAVDLRVEKLSDLNDKVIPFFTKYLVLGVKALDFADFTKVADLMKDKNHLNQEGLDQIRKIKAGMNRGR